VSPEKNASRPGHSNIALNYQLSDIHGYAALEGIGQLFESNYFEKPDLPVMYDLRTVNQNTAK